MARENSPEYRIEITDGNESEESVPALEVLNAADREVVAHIRRQLDKIVDIPRGPHWAIGNAAALGMEDLYVKNIRENISRSQAFLEALHTEPEIFDDLFWHVGGQSLEDPKDIEDLVHNVIVRSKEILRNQKERNNRILANPIATEEEYRLGRWKELLESQVRGAVLELEKRGYQPYASGFDDLAEGSQSIWFNKTSSVNVGQIDDVLHMKISEQIASKIFQLSIIDDEDTFKIEIIPKDRALSLNEWKIVWDNIAPLVPELEQGEGSDKIFNGTQGDDFREAQDKVKQGKSAWLEYGLAYVGGKVIEMPQGDYVKSGIEELERELDGLVSEAKYKKGDDIKLIQIEIDKIRKELEQKTATYIRQAETSAKLQ